MRQFNMIYVAWRFHNLHSNAKAAESCYLPASHSFVAANPLSTLTASGFPC